MTKPSFLFYLIATTLIVYLTVFHGGVLVMPLFLLAMLWGKWWGEGTLKGIRRQPWW